MSELNLPSLSKNYRWKIDTLYRDEWDAVTVRLQKKHWFFGWLTVRSQNASTMVVGSNLNEEVSKAAQNIWEIQFGNNPATKISGVYYGNNQHRSE